MLAKEGKLPVAVGIEIERQEVWIVLDGGNVLLDT
jgi:hypothetical protein